MPRPPAPAASSISAQAQQNLVLEGLDDFDLPKSIVTKVARSAIPEFAKLQKDAISVFLNGSSVFINYLSATAHDVAISKQHKSISATDVLKALEILDLPDFAETLQEELLIYRELAKTDKSLKGTSTIISAATRGKPGAGLSVSTSVTATGSAKVKAKDKGKASLPPPEPLNIPDTPAESISAAPTTMVIDEDAEVEEEEEEIVEDDDADDDDAEEDDLQDTIAVDEEEMRKDAKGLDESVPRKADEQMVQDD